MHARVVVWKVQPFREFEVSGIQSLPSNDGRGPMTEISSPCAWANASSFRQMPDRSPRRVHRVRDMGDT